MPRNVRLVLVFALLVMITVPPAFAGAAVGPAVLPPPPPDGTRVPISLWGGMESGLPPVYEWPVGSGTWYLDGLFGNATNSLYSGGVTVRQPYLTVEYRTAGSAHISYETFPAPAAVMPPNPSGDYFKPFHHRLTVPAGADPTKTVWAYDDPSALDYPKYNYATAASTLTFQTLSDVAWGPVDTALGGWRTHGTVTVRNTGSEIVGIANLTSRECYGVVVPDFVLDTFDVTANDPAKAARLAPGESTTFDLKGLNPTPTTTPGFLRFTMQTTAEAYPLSDALVWRFYNRRTGTHFYTADPNETASVIANLGGVYSLDGLAYTVVEKHASNTTVLWRFYNKRTGTHFYTADPNEKATILATMGATYAIDGPAYYVSSTHAAGYDTVWRFYNKRTGTHFYTADPNEKAAVEVTLGSIYALDGPAFYLAR